MSKLTTVGDKVKLKKDNLLGTVKFIGPMKDKKSTFYGVELDETGKGSNNGTKNGHSYFKTTGKKGTFVLKKSIAKTMIKKNPAPRVTVGDQVKHIKSKCKGTIKWIGYPDFKPNSGVWYGIELEKPKGKFNGTRKDKWYFTTADRKGTFTQSKGFAVLSLGASSSASPSKAKADKDDKKVDDKPVKKAKKVKKDKKSKKNAKNDDKTDKKDKKKGKKVKKKVGEKDDKKVDDKKGKKDKKQVKSGKKKGKKVKKDKAKAKPKDVNYELGDKVIIKPKKKGQIRWIGADKAWGDTVYYGIRLLKDTGEHDGQWKDVRHFQCPDKHGKYVPLRMIVGKTQFDDDFMNEDEMYEVLAAAKAEEFQKERDKLKLLRKKFTEYDKDNSQSIDSKEFNKLASDVFNCTSTEADALFKQIDVSKNGQISFAEFDAWVDGLGGVDALVKDDNKDDDNDDNVVVDDKGDDKPDDDKPVADKGDDDAGDDNDDNADNADNAADDKDKVDDNKADDDANKADNDDADNTDDKGDDTADKVDDNVVDDADNADDKPDDNADNADNADNDDNDKPDDNADNADDNADDKPDDNADAKPADDD